jgi:hypothetical protein
MRNDRVVVLSALLGLSTATTPLSADQASVSGQATGGEAQIQLVPAANEVELSGRPGSDLSLTQRITLMANKDVHELLFRPGDLTLEGGSEVISRTQVQLVSGSTALQDLKGNTPRDVDFKVSGLKVPGTYSGAIEFLQPQHGLTAAIHFNLKVHMQETPKLSLRNGSTNIKIQIVNCFPWIGCYLIDTLYGPTEDHSFPLDNGSLAPFTLLGAVAAYGEVNHHNTGDSLQLDLSKQIPPSPIVTIPLTVRSGDLTPDHYVGDVQLHIPAKDEPLKIPLELNVKTGPELPILILIIGILFGRLIKYMKDKGVPQSDLLRQLLQVQARAAQDPQNLGLLQHMLEQVRTDIDQMHLDSAKSGLALIESRLTLLARLRVLETLLTPRAADTGVAAVLKDIKLARSQISLEVDPTATANRIEAEVRDLPAPADAADPAVRALEVAAATAVRGAAPFAAPPKTPPPSTTRLQRVVALITGHSDALRADLTLWFLRPMLWASLILLLTVTGFLQLYAKNPSFGADLVSDYFGLLVWATGSDIASRTLSNFKGS